MEDKTAATKPSTATSVMKRATTPETVNRTPEKEGEPAGTNQENVTKKDQEEVHNPEREEKEADLERDPTQEKEEKEANQKIEKIETPHPAVQLPEKVKDLGKHHPEGLLVEKAVEHPETAVEREEELQLQEQEGPG